MSVDLSPGRMFEATQTTITAAPFSIVAYFKPEVVNVTQMLCSLISSTSTSHRFSLQLTSTAFAAVTQAGAGAASAAAAGAVANTWYSAAAIFDVSAGTDRLIDPNGIVEAVNNTVRVPTGINRIRIGGLNASSNNWNGEIERIAIYDRVLAKEERDQLGSADSSFYMFDPRLVEPDDLVWMFEFPDAVPVKVGGYGPELTWVASGLGSNVKGVGPTSGVYYPMRSGYSTPVAPAAATFNAAWCGATHLVGAGVVG